MKILPGRVASNPPKNWSVIDKDFSLPLKSIVHDLHQDKTKMTKQKKKVVSMGTMAEKGSEN